MSAHCGQREAGLAPEVFLTHSRTGESVWLSHLEGQVDIIVFEHSVGDLEFVCEVYKHAVPKAAASCPSCLWFTLPAWVDAIYPKQTLDRRSNLIGRMSPNWVKLMERMGMDQAQEHLRRSAKSLAASCRVASDSAPGASLCLSSEQEFSLSPAGFMFLTCGVHACKKYKALQDDRPTGGARRMLDCFLSFWLECRTIHFATRAGILVVFDGGVLLLGPLLESCDTDRYSPFRHLFEGRETIRPAEFLLVLAEDSMGTRRTPSWSEKVGSLLEAVIFQLAELIECTKEEDHWARHNHFSLRALLGVKRLRRISVARKQVVHAAVAGSKRVKRVSTLLVAQDLVASNTGGRPAQQQPREALHR